MVMAVGIACPIFVLMFPLLLNVCLTLITGVQCLSLKVCAELNL